MKLLFSIFCFILLNSFCTAQEQIDSQPYHKVDYVEIEKTITNEDSQFFYPNLFKRLKYFDTTLTVDDFFYLYYGYSCQESYRPYAHSDYQLKLNDCMKKNDSPENQDSIIMYAYLVLDDLPFNLTSYAMLHYIYKLKGETEKSEQIADTYIGIIDAMMTTGDGLSEETAIHVLSTDVEYDIIYMLGYEFDGQALTPNGCDAMSLKNNQDGINVLYFNVTRLFEKNNK